MKMKFWSPNDKIAFCGVLLAVLGLIGTICVPEIRHLTGLDPSASAAQPASIMPVAATVSIPAPADLQITSLGDRTVITILPAKTPAQETASPISQKGQRLKETYYLGNGKHASISMTGQNNTVILAPEVKSRVAVSTVGDHAKIKVLGEK